MDRWGRQAKFESRKGMRFYKRRLRLANDEGRQVKASDAPKPDWLVLAPPLPKGMFAASPMPEEEELRGLAVPHPSEKVLPEDVSYQSREGQKAFRELVLQAYGRCAVTGSRIEGVLEAAHVIPYVDHRSNVVTNGLCLRADIHRLYDRGLLLIGSNFKVHVSPKLATSAYSKLEDREIKRPENVSCWPDARALAIRHRLILGGM